VGLSALVSRLPLIGAVSEGLVMRGSGATVRGTAIRGRGTGTERSPDRERPNPHAVTSGPAITDDPRSDGYRAVADR
jgi:hypothetical protein